MSTTGLAVHYGDETGLAQWRDPETVLAEAQRSAEALGRVIALKKNPVIFNGEQYLELEDWQTVGKFYGLTAKVLETRYVEYGGVTGWEAVAVCIDKNGTEVSRAESMCMTDEATWGAVPVYEWKDILDANGKKQWVEGKGGKKGYYKAEKTQVGTQPKPSFQLRSMAQTRACAKAFRQVLSWVVVLGGFRPNVAEEMIESQLGPDEPQQTRQPVQQPQRASEKAKAATTQPEPQKQQDEAPLTISGTIETSKAGGKDTTWLTVDKKLICVEPDKMKDEMAEGNFLKATVKPHQSDKIGTYYKIVEVLECSSVVDAEVEETVEQPAEGQQVLEGLKSSGAVKTGAQVEATAAAKEKSWKAHVGHDPEKHITYKQGNLLFKIQGGRELSEETVKNYLKEKLGVEHRYLIPKERFAEVLDDLDPDEEYHERKEK